MANTSTFSSSDGDGYEAQMGRWSKRLAPLMVDFAGLASARSVLDVGCGTGSLAFELARNPNIRSVEGIDLCPAYIAYADRRARNSRPRFRVADACALPFPDATFDHSLSSLVLQFIPDAGRAAREMRRVTRAGGVLAVTTWDTQNFFMHRMFFETAAELDADARERRAEACARPMARSDGLKAMWHDLGLAGITLGRLSISMTFTSFDDFWIPMDGTDGPYAQYLANLDARHKAELRERLRAVYLNGSPDGSRTYEAAAWAIKGTVM